MRSWPHYDELRTFRGKTEQIVKDDRIEDWPGFAVIRLMG